MTGVTDEDGLEVGVGDGVATGESAVTKTHRGQRRQEEPIGEPERGTEPFGTGEPPQEAGGTHSLANQRDQGYPGDELDEAGCIEQEVSREAVEGDDTPGEQEVRDRHQAGNQRDDPDLAWRADPVGEAVDVPVEGNRARNA